MPLDQSTKMQLRHLAANVLHYARAAQLLQFTSAQPWRILMYHRIVRPQDITYPLQPGMYATPEAFAEHMEHLARTANVLPLDDLVTRVAKKEVIPHVTVAITFDDGWLDSYTNAFPILRRYELPATIFLATAFVGTYETLWGDKVALAVTALRGEKQYLSAVCSRMKERGDVNVDICRRIVSVLSDQSEEGSIDNLDSLIESLKSISLKQRKIIVSALTTLAKEFTSFKIPRSFLNWDEVQQMAADGITFGSHSHKHYPADELSEAQLSDELDNSYQMFRQRSITPSAVFCYPGGNYSALSQQVLAKKEIRYALTTEKGAKLDSQPMLLGRIGIHQDIASTVPLFNGRVWFEQIF